jgi:hypothetical protein
VTRVDVHRLKNPLRKRFVQVAANQQPNVNVSRKRRDFLQVLMVSYRLTASSELSR